MAAHVGEVGEDSGWSTAGTGTIPGPPRPRIHGHGALDFGLIGLAGLSRKV